VTEEQLKSFPHADRRNYLRKLDDIQKMLNDIVNDFKRTCNHELEVPSDFYEKLAKDPFHSATGRCKGCGESFGWFCPSSPNHICNYDKYGNDSCEFCGMPDERK